MKFRRTAALALFVLVSLSAHSSVTKKQVEGDVRELYSNSVRARTEAADRLVAAGPTAIPLLLPVVCDQSEPNFDRVWPAAAKVLGELKAQAATRCLVPLLLYRYPSIGPVIMKSDKTLTDVDPAFAALVQIGEPAVPEIRQHLSFLPPEAAIAALRVLRLINTPSAKEAAQSYIKVLEDQTNFAKQVLGDFGESLPQ